MLNELMNRPFVAEAKEGMHDATLTGFTYKPHANNPANDYMEMKFNIDNIGTDKIPLKRNMFERDLSIMLSHLRRQLNRANETIQPRDFLQSLIDTKTPFKLWVSYPIVGTKNGPKRVQNIYFIEPIAEEETSAPDEIPPMID